MIHLQEGAVLVADAHYASYRPLFHTLVDKIISKEIVTNQLLLMGDVFDLLMGPIDAFVQCESVIIDKLNQLSLDIEVIYLEGNHDFALASIFPHMEIYPLALQSVNAIFNEQEGFLAHGDWGGSAVYRAYTTIIRNKIILKLLNFADLTLNAYISKKFSRKMRKKLICSKFEGFEDYIKRKFKNKQHQKTWFIEGHYHQGSSFFIDGIFYNNLEAMACNKSYFVVQSNNYAMVLSHHTL